LLGGQAAVLGSRSAGCFMAAGWLLTEAGPGNPECRLSVLRLGLQATKNPGGQPGCLETLDKSKTH